MDRNLISRLILQRVQITANNEPNAFSVIAVANKGDLLSAPDTYMEKIAVGANLPKNLLDIDFGVEKILTFAKAKNKISDLNVCVLKSQDMMKL